MLKLLKEYLGIKTQVIPSSSLLKRLPKDPSLESRLIEIFGKVGGDTLYEGAAGQNYIDANIFKAHREYIQKSPYWSNISTILAPSLQTTLRKFYTQPFRDRPHI